MLTGRSTLAFVSGLLLFGAVNLHGSTSFPRSIVPVEDATAPQTSVTGKSDGRIVRTTLTRDELDAVLCFDIALKLRNRDELDARLSRGEILSPAELEPYLPTADDYAKIRSWLVAQGFRITLDADTRHAIFAKGPNSMVAAAFGVKLARVATADGEFTSAISAPALPDEIAGAVAGIRGLQPHLIRHPHSTRNPQQLEATSYYAITPAAVAATYQTPGSLTGSGQTIAVICDAKVKDSSDLATFWSECGVSQSLSNFTTINVGSGPGNHTDDEFELMMDIEWTSGLAPAAKIRFYATTYPLASDNEAQAYTQILNDLSSNPNLHQVSESFGGTEAPFELNEGDTALPLLAAQGVTCFASSGDGGSNPSTDSTVNTYDSNAPVAVNYPASDPYMTAVGGTTLIFPQAQNGSPSFPEVAWSVDATGSNGTGGGISVVFNRPSWQVASGLPGGNKRCVPDVSALADTGDGDSDMGAFVFQGGTGYGGGGTSLSSPIWAGFCALINQARATAGLAPVGYLNPKLYQAAGTSCFNDITSGSNGAYQAGAGYDLCTGLGTPSMGNLISFLTATSVAPTITTQPASQAIAAGNPVTFSAAASGNPTPTFQWKKNTVNINGATGSSFTINSVAAGDAGAYTVVASNSAGSATSNSAVLTVQGHYVVSDFNGDGHTDLLWENTAGVDRAIWYLNGTGIAGFDYLAGVPIEWKIVGTADFDGDGHTDILWEDTLTGDRSIWLMNGTAILNFAYLAYVDPSWHIAALGDFNGDGQTDLLWENAESGGVDRAIWYLNGTNILGFGYLAGIPSEWHIVGAGDFNGDGKTDIVWENTLTGDRSIWLMDGTNILSFFDLGNVAPAWHIAMVADFDGDGKVDLLWENRTTGDRVIWLMNGTTHTSSVYLAYVDPVWHIAP